MKIKFLCFVSFILLSTSSLYSQRDRVEHLPNFDKPQLHFGYYLGINKKGFKVAYDLPDSYVEVEESLGFNIGVVVDYKLLENLNLRFEPGLSSNTKKLTFSNPVIPDNESDRVRDVSGTYMRLPLLLKYSSKRLDNMKAFVIGGVSYDFNFSSNQNNVNDNYNGEFRMKKNNFMYEVGVGVDIYLPYFKFSPSLRGIFAINNELVYDDNPSSPWTRPIDYFGTRGVFLNLTFE